MNRVVRGSDGRMWTIRGTLEWSNPIAGEDFEHDVSGGPAPAVVLGGTLMLLALLFVLWTPESVYVPSALVLALVLVALFFPVRWLIRRPWSVVAETPGTEEDQGPERWVGVVRGMLTARKEMAGVARNIEVYAEPDVNGTLQPTE